MLGAPHCTLFSFSLANNTAFLFCIGRTYINFNVFLKYNDILEFKINVRIACRYG